MLLFRQFSDRQISKQSQKKLIRNLGAFVTEVEWLEFLLNTEENIHNLLKNEKPISSAFSVQIYRAWEKQKDQVFLQIDGFLTAQPCCSEQLRMLGAGNPCLEFCNPHKKQEIKSNLLPLRKLFTN